MVRRAYVLASVTIIMLAMVSASPSSAAIGWRIKADVTAASAADDGTLAFGSGRTVTMLGPDGNAHWSWTAPGDITFIDRGTEASVYAAYEDKLVKLDARGRLAWSAKTYEKVYSLMALPDGRVVVGSGYGALAYDRNGAKIWENDPQNAIYPIYDCAT